MFTLTYVSWLALNIAVRDRRQPLPRSLCGVRNNSGVALTNVNLASAVEIDIICSVQRPFQSVHTIFCGCCYFTKKSPF
jgi:hypothetical protein